MSAERRRSPRVEILGRLHGHVLSLDAAVAVRDMNLSGMAIETDFVFPEGAVHEFEVTLGDGSTVQMVGRVLRCRSVGDPEDPPAYVAAIEFIDEDPDQGTAVAERIIEKLK